MALKNPAATLRSIEATNAELSDEVRRLRQGDYARLFKQTRSFLDALQRSPKGRPGSSGPAVTSIATVRDCLEDSRRQDGERPTHFTAVLGHFLGLVDSLRALAGRTRERLGDAAAALSVRDRQREAAGRIGAELDFWERYVEEHNDFTDLDRHKTLEEFRGLNTGEVPVWGAVVNLVPVLLKTADGIAELTAKWCSTTQRLGMGIYEQRPGTGGQGSRPESRTRGSAGQRPASRSGSASAKAPERTASGDGAKSRKTYADKMDEKYKGRISLLERSPWKPSSQEPHNLYPQLHIHLGKPTNNVPYN